MSHFCCAVFANNPDDFDRLLAPYREEDDTPYALYDYYTLNAKDYYFEDFLKPNTNKKHPYRLHDYDLTKEDEDIDVEQLKKQWELIRQASEGNQEANKRLYTLFDSNYYIERYKTREQFIKEMSHTLPYCFITPDGELHAPGRVWWFAISDETAESWNKYFDEWMEFVSNKAINPYVSFVDCHI